MAVVFSRGPRAHLRQAVEGDAVVHGLSLRLRGRRRPKPLHRPLSRWLLRVRSKTQTNRLRGAQTGELLIEALQSSPHKQVSIEPSRTAMPVRAVKL